MNIKKIAVFGAAGKMGMGIVETILAQIKNCSVVAFAVGLSEPKRYGDVISKLNLDLFHLRGNDKKLLFKSSREVTENALRVAWYETNPKNIADWLPECDLIIEAVFEDLEVKRGLFKLIEKYIKPETPIMTNTSTIRIETLTKGMAHPERLIGFHFFNPVPMMKAVECILHASTNENTLRIAEDFATRIGKNLLFAPDTPGFSVNGAYVPAIIQVLKEIEAGAKFEDIDNAFTTGRWVIFPPARRIVEVLINESMGMIQKYKDDPRLNHFSKEQAKENIEGLMKLGTSMPAGPFELDELLRSGEAEKMARDIKHPQRWKICLAMGPAKFIDLVGIDVALDCVRSMGAQMPEKGWQEPELLKKMLAEGKRGQKSGRGFYRYGPHVWIEYPETGYAKIVFENSKPNWLSMDLIKKLRSAFAELRTRPDLKTVFLQGFNGNFAAGADINEFSLCLIDEGIRKLAINEGRLLLNQIMDFSCPVIAIVEKLALGGGYEIPLVCDLIIGYGQVGLPEKGLGIMPGWLGTQTLARRVGFENALWMILGAEIVEASAPWIDLVLKRNELIWARLKAIADGAKKREFPILKYDLAQRLLYCAKWIELYGKVKLGQEPKPALLALKTIWHGNSRSLQQGADIEWDAVLEVFETKNAEKGIRHFLETGKYLYKKEKGK